MTPKPSDGYKFGYEVRVEMKAGMFDVITDSLRDGMREEISRLVVNAQEQKIREGLIALGWTPPPSEQEKG